jgi:hypothetical protein
MPSAAPEHPKPHFPAVDTMEQQVVNCFSTLGAEGARVIAMKATVLEAI